MLSGLTDVGAVWALSLAPGQGGGLPFVCGSGAGVCPVAPPPCGDTWLCQVMIAIKEIAKAPTCTAKEKRSRLITDRSDRP